MDGKKFCPVKDVLYEVGYPPYTVNTSIKQYKAGRWLLYAAIIVVLTLLLIGIISYMVSYSKGREEEKQPVTVVGDPSKPDYNLGATNTGDVDHPEGNANSLTDEGSCTTNNGVWNSNDNTCDCSTGFYGDMCQYHAHPRGMYYIENVDFESEQVPGSRVLTFTGNGTELSNMTKPCTQLCDEDEGCFGVTYDHSTKECSKIVSNPVLVKNGRTALVYSKGVRPVDVNNVYIYFGDRPLRYWSDRDDVVQIPKRKTVTYLTKSETKIVNDGMLTGEWINASGEVFIDQPTGPNSSYILTLPDSFLNRNVEIRYSHSDYSGPITYN